MSWIVRKGARRDLAAAEFSETRFSASRFESSGVFRQQGNADDLIK